MKVFSNKGKLEVVCYTLSELVNENEDDFCKALYEHTEGENTFDDRIFKIFKEAQDEVNRGCNYFITDDDDKKNKIRSWIDCLRFFKEMISKEGLNTIGNVLIGFEYHLKKRWIDAIIVCENKIIILEFKSGKSDDDYQIKGYLKQLNRYTNRIRRCNKEVVNQINLGNLTLENYLIFTNQCMINRVPKNPSIIVGDEFANVMASITTPCDISKFERILDGEKYLDPSISGALRALIHKGIVNYVKKDNDNVKVCNGIMHEILNSKDPTLGITIVKGGPGTGKTGTAFTLLEECLSKGITKVQYVTGNANLENYFNSIVEGEIDLVKQDPSANPLFQKLIKEKLFNDLEGLSEQLIGHIRELYSASNYCDNYFFNKGTGFLTIEDQVLLVDEAQRMWNYLKIATRSQKKSGKYEKEFDFNTQRIIYKNRLSEAYLLLFSAIKGIEKSQKSKNIILFIGNKQEINSGEEDGEKDILNSIYLLNRNESNVKIKVFVPDEEVKNKFLEKGVNCKVYPELMLKLNQRNDIGDPTLEIVNAILTGDTTLSKQIKRQKGYEVYNNYEDLLKALGYEENCTYDKEDESIGIVVSSYDCNPLNKGNYRLLETNLTDAGDDLYKYYYLRNSNKLNSFVSEFGCQGLEFDDTILIWGNTLLWRNGDWMLNPGGTARLKWHVKEVNKLISSIKKNKSKLLSLDEVINQFVKNAYRVLLTRARETTYIYVEDEATYNHLKHLLES